MGKLGVIAALLLCALLLTNGPRTGSFLLSWPPLGNSVHKILSLDWRILSRNNANSASPADVSSIPTQQRPEMSKELVTIVIDKRALDHSRVDR
ncbi:MAG: hypothetical protein ACI9BW_002933 [Gammaproteobacteria bacterium]|jgi:hypothetical protein